jgi:hypothetical protein
MLTVLGQSHDPTFKTARSTIDPLFTPFSLSSATIPYMSSSNLDALLYMIHPSEASRQREVVERDLATTKERLDVTTSVVPDDKEELCEEQADWCKRWEFAVVRDCAVDIVLEH